MGGSAWKPGGGSSCGSDTRLRVILRFGAKNVLHPEEGAVLSSDFQKASASEVYHYSPGVEPPVPKLEVHLPLPKSFPAFQETAEGFLEYFVDLCGTFWEEDLTSQETEAGQAVGFLWVLKDLRRKKERRWNIRVAGRGLLPVGQVRA